ncbi:uncharacterized protein AB675_2510 [Cyphellophora attinorum]|uniref:Uncharacterized protein n=1 Tax=Cyphellophora attinorum TaxID=1664694 RepID=A0A0N1HAQ6_9EURO|nr:uncharacterized protein AB675_2510 [Phialophora attinorum]KPI45197.1 hypothetical protein AB675_2510 [Phialophora attinorum]
MSSTKKTRQAVGGRKSARSAKKSAPETPRRGQKPSAEGSSTSGVEKPKVVVKHTANQDDMSSSENEDQRPPVKKQRTAAVEDYDASVNQSGEAVTPSPSKPIDLTASQNNEVTRKPRDSSKTSGKVSSAGPGTVATKFAVPKTSYNSPSGKGSISGRNNGQQGSLFGGQTQHMGGFNGFQYGNNFQGPVGAPMAQYQPYGYQGPMMMNTMNGPMMFYPMPMPMQMPMSVAGFNPAMRGTQDGSYSHGRGDSLRASAATSSTSTREVKPVTNTMSRGSSQSGAATRGKSSSEVKRPASLDFLYTNKYYTPPPAPGSVAVLAAPKRGRAASKKTGVPSIAPASFQLKTEASKSKPLAQNKKDFGPRAQSAPEIILLESPTESQPPSKTSKAITMTAETPLRVVATAKGGKQQSTVTESPMSISSADSAHEKTVRSPTKSRYNVVPPPFVPRASDFAVPTPSGFAMTVKPRSVYYGTPLVPTRTEALEVSTTAAKKSDNGPPTGSSVASSNKTAESGNTTATTSHWKHNYGPYQHLRSPNPNDDWVDDGQPIYNPSVRWDATPEEKAAYREEYKIQAAKHAVRYKRVALAMKDGEHLPPDLVKYVSKAEFDELIRKGYARFDICKIASARKIEKAKDEGTL